MFKNSFFTFTMLIAVMALVSCTSQAEIPEEPAILPTNDPASPPPTEEPIIEPTTEPDVEPDGRVTFEQLGISLEIPGNLVVIKDPIVNLDDPSKLESYTFYIQNYGPEDGPGTDYFQIYGMLQYSIPPVVWEEYASDVLNSDMYSYAREVEFNGLKGLDTQLGGERNRFVYHINLDGRVLSMAVSDPTEINKALADQIISTLEYSQGAVTDASGMQLVSEPNGYYQMYLPSDWEYGFNTTGGIRVSDMEASSPGAEVVVEESDGPHDNIYYKDGIFLNVVILEDPSANTEPVMAQVLRSNPIMISGIGGMDYVFLEPSTIEGEIRELRYYHNDLSFLIRFSYAENADLAEIDWLVRNFQISQ